VDPGHPKIAAQLNARFDARRIRRAWRFAQQKSVLFRSQIRKLRPFRRLWFRRQSRAPMPSKLYHRHVLPEGTKYMQKNMKFSKITIDFTGPTEYNTFLRETVMFP
jgi:hypothetical protein